MAVLLWGCLLYVVALALHVIMWRIHRPRKPITTLLLLFSVVGITGLAVQWWGRNIILSFRAPVLANLPAYFHVVVFYVSLALAYIVCYTLIEWDSPTIAIVLKLMRAGQTGLRKADLVQSAIESYTMESRLQGLLRAKTIVKVNGRYTTSSGSVRSLFYLSVLAYGRLLGLERRGG